MHGELCRSKPLGCQEVGSINNYFSIKVVVHLKFHDVPALLLSPTWSLMDLWSLGNDLDR
jgi:hypothetical protein